MITNLYLRAEIFEEVNGGALIKVLLWVLHHPEDDCLGDGEEDGEHPGGDDHEPVQHSLILLYEFSQPCKPGPASLSLNIQREQRFADTDGPA